jgi:hypothetical protein
MERREPLPRGKQIRRSTDDDARFGLVGAFAVTGIGQEALVASVSSSGDTEAPPTTDSTTAVSSVVPVYAAHVVDEETASTIVDVMPMKELEETESASHQDDTQLMSRKCRIISAWAAVALCVGVIVAVVLVTQNGSKAAIASSPTQAPEIATDEFLSELMPLLTNESLSALENIDSPQSLALGWLSRSLNFQELSFRQKVQRYAMATIYYATGGPSWTNAESWLTTEPECTWFQGSIGDSCDENGTLHSLNQSSNALFGKIPDEIRLMSSLKVIDLTYNKLSGTIPVEIFGGSPSRQRVLVSSNNWSTLSFTETLPSDFGSLTALTSLSLDHNSFTGTLASELGSMSTLNRLSLVHNKLKGTLPSELGFMTALTRLSLDNNILTGTLPSELGSLTALNSFSVAFNSIRGTVPSEFGSLTALTWLMFFWNSITGTLPSEIASLTMTIFP